VFFMNLTGVLNQVEERTVINFLQLGKRHFHWARG
jgi:hypothetical protein